MLLSISSHCLWGFCVCLCSFAMHYFVAVLVFNQLDKEERVGCCPDFLFL